MKEYKPKPLTQKNVIGVFNNSFDAKQAILHLENAGFTPEQINIITGDESLAETLNASTKASKGGVIGGIAGGLLGAIAAGLAVAGSITIPGVNVLVYGAAITTLIGTGAGIAAGGLTGLLIGLGIPENEALAYKSHIEEGSILIAVETKDVSLAKMARNIFEQQHAGKIKG